MSKFLDYLALWVAVNAVAWFANWMMQDKNVTVQDETHLLLQTSIAATAITLAVWGIARVTGPASSIPKKFQSWVDSLPGPWSDKEKSDERPGE